ncbi:MAG TPA: DsbA family protein [Acetobacteraceae bacterium]|nr:DsbA family protein [Acetobacteraceae bacterium]
MRFLLPVLLAPLLLAAVVPARADQFTPAQRDEIVHIMRDALKQDPTILRDAVEALQADEGSRQEAAARGAIAASRQALTEDPADPVAGNPKGDITIVEFFDTRCPYCRKLEPTMTALLKSDHGVRLVYKDLPILGPASVVGSKSLLAAQRQEDRVPGAYEKLREALMRPGAEQTREAILAEAGRLGLDTTRLGKDMDDPAIQRRIDVNLRLARTLGIQGTPALVIGDTLIPGAVETAELERAIKTARAGGR